MALPQSEQPLVDETRRITRPWLLALQGFGQLFSGILSTSTLLGRGSATSGPPEPITLGTGLTMSGTTLSATGSGGTVTHTGALTAGKNVIGNGTADVTVSSLTANLVASATGTLSGAVAAASSKLVGSGATGSGAAYSEIALGTNLSMSGTTLNAATGAGTVTHTGALTSGELVIGNGTADITVGNLTGDVTTSGATATTIAALAVTTGKIAAAAVTLPKIQNATANSVLIGSGASGSGASYVEVALGTNLSMSGTTLNASNGGPGGGAALTLLSGQTASSTTELDFTSIITSSYDEYLIEFVNLVTAASTAVQFQVSTNNGSTYDTSAIYGSQGYLSRFSGGSGDFGSSSVTGFVISAVLTLDANSSWNGSFRLMNPLGALYKIFFGQYSVQDSAGPPNGFASVHMTGLYKSTTAVNAFRVTARDGGGSVASNGLTSGVVRVYGIGH